MNALLTIEEADGPVGSGVSVEADNAAYPKLTFSLAGVETKIKEKFLDAPAVASILASEAYTTHANAWLASIPHEAIKSVTTNDAVATYGSDLFVANVASKGLLSTATTSLTFAIQNLFEQTISANRLQPLGDDRTVATNFVAGDKVKIYVNNTVGKSRTYSIDGAAAGQTATAKFMVGGVEKTLGSTALTVQCDANAMTRVSYTLVASA
jgi:hypothetical protein